MMSTHQDISTTEDKSH